MQFCRSSKPWQNYINWHNYAKKGYYSNCFEYYWVHYS